MQRQQKVSFLPEKTIKIKAKNQNIAKRRQFLLRTANGKSCEKCCARFISNVQDADSLISWWNRLVEYNERRWRITTINYSAFISRWKFNSRRVGKKIGSIVDF